MPGPEATSEDVEESLSSRVRALRLLQGWSHEDLAEAAKVSRSVIADIELGRSGATAEAKSAILAAFSTEPTEGGPVDMSTRASGQPLRWITATDIAGWGRTRNGQDTLPELINRLIRAEYGSQARLRFPSGDSVAQPGWDGQSIVLHATEFVPSGGAGWEIGGGRKPAKTKADEDWTARTTASVPPSSEGLGERRDTTLMVVTTHRWSEKDTWVEQRRREGVWKDVRVLDADNLVQWIERHAAVAQWLAIKIGKRPPGLKTLEELWSDWALATATPFSPELSVVGRDVEAAEVVRWLCGAPSVLSLQADSTEEAAAFLFACIAVLPRSHREAFLSRAVAPETDAAAREVGAALTPLLILLQAADAGSAAGLARQGHHVFVAAGPDGAVAGARPLSRPTRWDLLHALLNLGLPYDRAERLSRDAGRSLTTLRRLMPPAPGRRPAWATASLSRPMAAALLAGGWLDTSVGDREVLERLSGLAYDDFERAIVPNVIALDGPFRKTESLWRLKSPLDAWGLLGPALTAADIREFLAAADTIFSEIDPTFALPADERWLAPVRDIYPRFSGALMSGIADSLILLCLRGAVAITATDVRALTERAIATWLGRATAAQWWSVAPMLPRLAEAAPQVFLQAARAAMEGPSPPIAALFEAEDNRGHTTPRHIHLVWALEGVAWDADRLREAVNVLACLTRFDPGGRNVTRPEEQLARIFLAWSPQTNAGSAARLLALDELRRDHPEVAWRVMVKAIPMPGGILMGGHRAKWRDDASDRRNDITEAEIENDLDALAARLVADAGLDHLRWTTLLEIMERLTPASRGDISDALLRAVPRIAEQEARAHLRTALRKVLARHSEFQDAWWAIPSEELAGFARAYDLLEPTDPLWRHAWLFSNGTRPASLRGDWQEAEQAAAAARTHAVEEILRDQHLAGLRALRTLAARTDWLAEAILESEDARRHSVELIEDGLQSQLDPAWPLARALIQCELARGGRDALSPWLRRAEGDTELTVRLLLQLRPDAHVWARAGAGGPHVETSYWRQLQGTPICETQTDLQVAVEKLTAVRRAGSAVALVQGALKTGVDADLVFRVLEALLETQAAEDENDEAEDDAARDDAGSPYEIARLFAHLADLPDIEQARLQRLEWAYFDVLLHTEYPARSLRNSLASDPEAFVVLLKLAYAPDEDSEVTDPPLTADLRKHAAHAYHVLDSCRPIPGSTSDGTIDAAALKTWTVAMRIKAKAAGRLGSADMWLGRTLAAAGQSPEATWPPQAVATVLEAIDSERLLTAFELGARTRRGVTVRMPSDGGRLEELEAARYRRDAEAMEAAFPVTSMVLRRIADSYLEQAHREDRQAEHYAWSG